MNKYRFSFLIISIFSLFLIACNDKPTSIGSDLLPTEDQISFSEYDTRIENVIQKSDFYEKKILLGSAYKVIVGKNTHSESSALMQFNVYLSDSLKQYALNNQLTINRAWIELPLTYWLGNKNLPFDFSVHNINSPWSPVGFNRDSLNSLNYNPIDISSERKITDTLITFDLTPDAVLSWLIAQADTNSGKFNRGFFMKPSNSSQRFIGFNAVRFIDDSKLPLFYIGFETPTNYKDTIVVTPYTDIHVVESNLPSSTDDILLQGGFATQGSIFFDVSSLPKDIIINKAELELWVNLVNTIDGEPKSDTIGVRVYKDFNEKTFTADSSTITILKREEDKFIGDIGWIVQKWLSDSSTQNQGINLFLYDQLESVAQISLYGSNTTDLALKPRLRIVYLQKNK